MNRLVMSLVAVFVLISGLIFPVDDGHAAFGLFGSHKKAKSVDGQVRIPLADVNDGKAHYYQYKDKGNVVKFFVVKSKDGVIRAAFDACDVCFPAKKGYTQDGDFMVCNNCGRRFHSNRINLEKGGCNPAPLKRQVVGDRVIIAVNDILPGGRFF